MQKLTARDIIRIALEVEQTGMHSYREMKQATQDQELNKLLGYLEKEEEDHISIFSKMFKDIEINPATMPEPSPEDQAYLDSIMKSTVFEGPQAGIKRAKEAKTPIDILKLSLQFERDSMLFWTRLFKMVRETDRPLIQRLIEQEDKHVRDIESLLNQRQRTEPKKFW
ncbi:MAG: ferritin family protein [candidate division WOR-3 bacterium]|nr:ferritin family protein [candidate division WOR-3 bacterium]